MTNQISLDPELSQRLNAGMQLGNAIELPFPVVYLWTLNGQASYKAQSNPKTPGAASALYFGGWACKPEDAQAAAEQQGLAIPAGWVQATLASRDGADFEAYTTRSVICAPFARRVGWMLDDNRHTATYVEGGRRHVQALVYLAEKQGGNGDVRFIPWGPVVLTAKGYQARNLLDAFAAWDKAIKSLARKAAPGVPSWCFYMALGTFGQERIQTMAGKAGAQSPITPISAYVPPDLSPEKLVGLFVGPEVAALMVDLQDQAKEWLTAWSVEQPAAGQPDEYGNGPDNWPPQEEIPF